MESVSDKEGPHNPTVENKAAIKNTREVLDHVGKLEIRGYTDTVAEKHAIDARNENLDSWEENSTYPRQILENLMTKEAIYVTNPASPYAEVVQARIEKGVTLFTPLFVFDVNGTIMEGRQGKDAKHSFGSEFETTLKKIIDNAGAVFVSALPSESMVKHMQKEHRRAREAGEKSFAEDVIMSAENGRCWLIPRTENGKTRITEYRQPLSEKKLNSLAKVKGKMEDIAEVLRGESMVGFVNDQKFSKCTMEGGTNGRKWYEEMIAKVALPYLAKNGADWNGNREGFSLDGIRYVMSPTQETIEIEITEGSDKIGKGAALHIIEDTLSDIFAAEGEIGVFYKDATFGDSPKGSDRGLTDPGRRTFPHYIQSSDKPAGESMEIIKNASEIKRKCILKFGKDTNGKSIIEGVDKQTSHNAETILETVPLMKIPTEQLTKYFEERLVHDHGFEKYKEYDVENDMLMLYNFPKDLTPEQKELFLNSKSDLIVPTDDQEKVNEFIDRINQKLVPNQQSS
jgi:hypothetical protein